jgi:hypothetical protein
VSVLCVGHLGEGDALPELHVGVADELTEETEQAAEKAGTRLQGLVTLKESR